MMAEQAFLNWQFGIEGAFPASLLAREYEKGFLKVVHEKLWVDSGFGCRRSGSADGVRFWGSTGVSNSLKRAKDDDSAQA
jgi:hypothetical protein